MTPDHVETARDALPLTLVDALETGPFARALQLAISHSGLALSRLEYHLEQRGFHVGRSTLSYWQQGRRRPERADSLEALAALETILGLPVESLSALLGPRKPRGRWITHQSGTVGWADMWGPSDDIKKLVITDSRRNAEKLRDISIFERCEIGPNRRMNRLQIQTVTEAYEVGADRSLLIYNADADLDVTLMKLTDLENCRIGRTRVLPDANFAAYELLFDHALVAKETYLYSYTIDFTGADLPAAELARRGVKQEVATEGQRGFRRPVHSYVLEVRFDADVLPVRCYYVQASRMGDPHRQLAELTLNAHHAVHIALQNVQPGVHGLVWEWD